jgi:hypothetical protein
MILHSLTKWAALFLYLLNGAPRRGVSRNDMGRWFVIPNRPGHCHFDRREKSFRWRGWLVGRVERFLAPKTLLLRNLAQMAMFLYLLNGAPRRGVSRNDNGEMVCHSQPSWPLSFRPEGEIFPVARVVGWASRKIPCCIRNDRGEGWGWRGWGVAAATQFAKDMLPNPGLQPVEHVRLGPVGRPFVQAQHT